MPGKRLIRPCAGERKPRKNYAVYKKEKTVKDRLKTTLDALIPQVSSFEELLFRLKAACYEIKRGKYVSCLVPGQERYTRLKTLGAAYTEEAIRERLKGRRVRRVKTQKTERGVLLLIDIENSIKATQSQGYEQWTKIHDLKQAAKALKAADVTKLPDVTALQGE